MRYGERIRIVGNPMAKDEPLDASGGEKPLHLESCPRTVTDFAVQSRHQLVVMTEKEAHSTAWRIVDPDPLKRGGLEGQPIPADQPVVIEHVDTHQALCCEPYAHINDFGKESEVSAHNECSKGSSHRLSGFHQGIPEVFKEKRCMDENVWHIAHGTKVEELPFTDHGSQAARCVLEKALRHCAKHGDNVSHVLERVRAIHFRSLLRQI